MLCAPWSPSPVVPDGGVRGEEMDSPRGRIYLMLSGALKAHRDDAVRRRVF